MRARKIYQSSACEEQPTADGDGKFLLAMLQFSVVGESSVESVVSVFSEYFEMSTLAAKSRN